MLRSHPSRRQAFFRFRGGLEFVVAVVPLEGQRQIKQLLDVDLQNKYGDVFRELSFEQRYSLCIEAPINFNGTNDLLRKWYEVYNNAKDKWFLAEEAYKIKEAVKVSIDCIRDQARQKLLQENSLWADWESAKEQLYIESCWNVQNRKGNVKAFLQWYTSVSLA